MKKMYLLAAVLLLLATNAVSYWAGSYNKDLQNGKDYEAAFHDEDVKKSTEKVFRVSELIF